MRDGDRFWWVILVVGLVFAAAGALMPYLVLNTFPWGDPYMTSTDYAQDLGIAGFITLLCLGAGVGFALACVPMLRRHRLRLAALRGDAPAIPAAALHPDPASAPDVAEQPLELKWRTSKGTRYIQGTYLVLELLIALASVATTIFALAGPVLLPALFAPSDPYTPPPPPMSLVELSWRLAGAFVILALLVPGGVFIARMVPFFFGRPFGITATATGLEKRTELGNRVHMAWDNMRLFEVTRGGGIARRGFVVYAAGKSISWMEYTVGLGRRYAPVGATASEMALRQTALLDLIAARTALTPRTFAKALEREPESVPAREASRSSGVIVLLVVALIMAGVAAAEAYFPVTPFTWLNWASVGSLALVTLLLLVATVRIALPPRPLPPHAGPPTVGAPSLEAPGTVYTFTWRPTVFQRLAYGASGLCLVVNLVPAVYVLLVWLAQWAALFLPGLRSQLGLEGSGPSIGQFALAFFLGIFGLFGLVFVYAATIGGATQIRANTNGLNTGRGRFERLILWSGVLDISWGQGAGGRTAYEVKTDVPTVQISWPSGPQAASGPPPRDGAIPIGADELAALVAARIGKPIRVRQ